jgi:hypothetical protein
LDVPGWLRRRRNDGDEIVDVDALLRGPAKTALFWRLLAAHGVS